MKTKSYIWIIVGVLLFGAIFAILSGSGNSFETVKNYEGEVTIYKSASCGCCGLYGGYFKREGSPNAEIVNTEDVDSIKDKRDIPESLRSCHTTIIDDYFIEGHIPLEAVEKLLTEKPDIAGIAMPGMPSGSPGMPGAKRGDFVIYAVNHDGTSEEFMRI